MNLYFMRHGIAVDRADSGAGSGDRERQLTPKGIKGMNKAAKGLATLSLSFDRILTSVAQSLHLEERVEEIEQLSPEQSAQDLLSGLVAYSGKKEILLVGHEPQLSSAISVLLSGTSGAVIRLKKGGLCCLQVDGLPPRDSAVLHWALTPKQLRLMAR